MLADPVDIAISIHSFSLRDARGTNKMGHSTRTLLRAHKQHTSIFISTEKKKITMVIVEIKLSQFTKLRIEIFGNDTCCVYHFYREMCIVVRFVCVCSRQFILAGEVKYLFLDNATLHLFVWICISSFGWFILITEY